MRRIFFILSLPLFVFADTEQDPLLKKQYKLSDKGKLRFETTFKKVVQAVNETDQNLLKSQKNLKILREEKRKLVELEKKHQDLIAKYEQYLNEAQKERADNKRRKEKLLEAEKKSPDAEQLQEIEKGKLEGELWSADAEDKMQTATVGAQETKRKLSEIHMKKKWVDEQTEMWTQKADGFSKHLKELQEKKQQLEALLQK